MPKGIAFAFENIVKIFSKTFNKLRLILMLLY